MSIFVDTTGLDNLIGRLSRLAHLNAEPLMQTWAKYTLPDDNRNGILKGLDKDGGYMLAVTYRPKGPTVHIKAKSASRFRNNVAANKRGTFAGFGLHASGLHNNLTRGEYEQLTGPPLAPRGQYSRVITNYTTDYSVSADGKVWTAFGIWLDVVSTKGVAFLGAHFRGAGRLPVRNLAGLRPEGRAEARRTFIAWASDQIRWNRP